MQGRVARCSSDSGRLPFALFFNGTACSAIGPVLEEALPRFSLDVIGIVASYAVCGSATLGAVPRLLFAFGSLGEGDVNFERAVDSGILAVAPDGSIWCGVYLGCQLFSSDGKFLRNVVQGKFQGPCTGIAFDNSEVFCSDEDANQIVVCGMDGSFVRSFSSSDDVSSFGPSGLAVDGKGLLFVVDGRRARIVVLRRDGSLVLTFGESGSGDGQFSLPRHIALSAAGELFITDSFNHRVQVLLVQLFAFNGVVWQVFDVCGKFVRAFGSRGSHRAQLHYPAGISLDRAGHVLVGDYENCRVQIFEQDGTFVTMFGSRGSAAGQFEVVNAVHVGCNDGAIYVADSGNMRVQVFGFAHWCCGV